MGLYFEDFQVGDVYTTPGRTVTEHDVMAFAGLSGDYNQLHTDEEFARGTMFGTRIAHGLLGLAIASGLKQRLGLFDGTAMAFLSVRNWDFKGPIKLGDTVHVRLTIADKRETSKPDRGVLVQKVELVNQRGETVQEGEHVLMIRRRPA
ncbi:MAG: MaoC family dehydratase N-terminal domain-containing protein [Clostridia bacterium]|nr:MaoC family dehydratase N-terminal domain-containing protein [Clostridia bacterium]